MLSIKWSNRAVKERAEILTYWVKRNASTTYSLKIEAETDKAISRIRKNPFIGERVKDRNDVWRLTLMRNYSLFYTLSGECLYILAFWDNRQPPDQLKV